MYTAMKYKSIVKQAYILIILAGSTFLIGCNSTHNANALALEATPDSVELFAPGIISTSLYERDFAISPSRDEIVYTLADYGRSKRCLVTIRRENEKWSAPKVISFSGQYHDIEPFFTADGLKLYFASNRPMNDTLRNDYNIWVSEKTSQGWGEPIPLDTLINSENDEFFPSLSKNNNLYFTSVRKNGIGAEDIFISKNINGNFTAPVPLDTAINTKRYEFNAWVNQNETLIIFSSFGRKDDLGGGDLYFSRKDDNGNWTQAKNMGPVINSDKLDYCPLVDETTGNFYFTSDRFSSSVNKIEKVSEIKELANGLQNGMGNIYRINLKGLGIDSK